MKQLLIRSQEPFTQPGEVLHKNLHMKPGKWEDLGIVCFSRLAKQHIQVGEHEAGPGVAVQALQMWLQASYFLSQSFSFAICKMVGFWRLSQFPAVAAGVCKRSLALPGEGAGKSRRPCTCSSGSRSCSQIPQKTVIRAVPLGLGSFGVYPG